MDRVKGTLRLGLAMEEVKVTVGGFGATGGSLNPSLKPRESPRASKLLKVMRKRTLKGEVIFFEARERERARAREGFVCLFDLICDWPFMGFKTLEEKEIETCPNCDIGKSAERSALSVFAWVKPHLAFNS